MRDGPRPRACAVPVVRPRHAKRHAPAASPSRGAGGGREAVAAGRRSWRGLGLERNATPQRDGRDGGDAREHAPAARTPQLSRSHAPHPLLPPWKLSSDCHPGCALLCSCAVLAHSTSLNIRSQGVSFKRPPNLDPCLVLYQDSRHAQQLVLEGHLAGSGHVCVKDGRAILAVGDARHG